MKDVQFHDAANIFPLISGTDFDELVEDVRKHGVRESIKLLDGKIIDGRNRYRASLLAGEKPKFVDVQTDDPVAYVVSLNLHRRHLTPSQCAIAAAKAMELYEVEAKKRQQGGQGGVLLVENLPQASKGKARDKAGEAFGVSGRTVDFGVKVLAKGTPELIKAVEEGRVAVSTAAVVAHESPEDQRRFVEEPKRKRVYKSEQGKPKAAGSTGAPVGLAQASSAMQFAQMAILQLQRIQADDPQREAAFSKVKDWIKNVSANA